MVVACGHYNYHLGTWERQAVDRLGVMGGGVEPIQQINYKLHPFVTHSEHRKKCKGLRLLLWIHFNL